MTNETEIERLKRVVGHQSVMLHNLKEKIQSLAMMADLDGEPIQAWEILQPLREWAEECDELVLEKHEDGTPE
jgi:hypothetical protein